MTATKLDKRGLHGQPGLLRGLLVHSCPPIQDLHPSRKRKRATKIISDATHIGHNLFELRPCGRGYRSLSTRKPDIRAAVSTGHLSHEQLTLANELSSKSNFHSCMCRALCKFTFIYTNNISVMQFVFLCETILQVLQTSVTKEK